MKKLNILWLLFALTVIGGCNFFSGKRKHLSKKEFTDVLVDIHLTEGAMSAKNFMVRTDSSVIRLLYNDILIRHDVTVEQFTQTLYYYTNNIREFDQIYKVVFDKLSKEEERVKKLEEIRIERIRANKKKKEETGEEVSAKVDTAVQSLE